jgi:hypothetical protein
MIFLSYQRALAKANYFVKKHRNVLVCQYAFALNYLTLTTVSLNSIC